MAGGASFRTDRMRAGHGGRVRCGLVAATLALLLALLAPLGGAAQDTGSAIQPVDAAQPAAPLDWTPPTRVYIPETGHTIDGLFLDLWREWGGTNAFGYPVTPEFTDERNHTIQYYGYSRFEYWPEGDADGNTVVLADLGPELRPAMVRRSVSAFGRGGNGPAHPVASEAAKAAKAWLPLPETAKNKPQTDDWRFVESSRHSVAGEFKTFWESAGEEYLGDPLSEEYAIGGTTYQVFERAQLAWTVETGTTMMPIGQLLATKYRLDQAPVGQGDVPIYDEALFVPPPPPAPEPEPIVTDPTTGVPVAADPNAERWIEVNLTSQYLTAWQGDVAVNETYVSTGRAGFDTPPGTYFVNTKLESETMEGVLGGEYYLVENVPWVMYFTDVGHALHGAYWHNNFGAVMSHGCVNQPMGFAEWLYGWAGIGTRVEIHY